MRPRPLPRTSVYLVAVLALSTMFAQVSLAAGHRGRPGRHVRPHELRHLGVGRARMVGRKSPRKAASSGHGGGPALSVGSAARGAHTESSSPPAPTKANLIWADEFNGEAGSFPDPQKWAAETGGTGWGNEELEYYTGRPNNAAVDGSGHMAITAQREPFGAGDERQEFTSARLATKGLFTAEYGRIEARIKLPSGRGLWPAFWAVGADSPTVGWPRCGEIDIMESLGQDTHTLYGTIHGPQSDSTLDYGLSTPLHVSESLSSEYHDYGIIWTPDSIAFTFDGNVYSDRDRASLTAGQEWVFNKPFFLRLNLAVGGSWPGPPDSSTPFPSQMSIDWVRVWQ